ncbi:transglutaminase domain-containing protein [Salarchaeum sp. JOR-1]|uniref:transglutaminase family protein n=1 Tax=Salarchaeum sp. JOR-1 TaxID=2599399 RepID=UPI001198AD8C|nr:transglutaminase domain-containing protein [Salarchaeum sp. JOR-1]QDX40026.1 transglutaminase [Salarchaeum sp. JOR-1]
MTDRFPVRPWRLAALASVAMVTASFLSVLYHVVDVVGGVSVFGPLAAASVALAVVFRALSERIAGALAAVLLAGGLAVYVVVMPDVYAAAFSVDRVLSDTVALLTGFSVLRMAEAGAWALAVTPGPVFLTWYFALRENYAASAAVGGVTLGFFVLTGDSGTVGTMVGVLGAFGALGFGTLDVHHGHRRQVEVVAAVLAVAVLASATVSAVPSTGSPLVPQSATAPEGSLVVAGDRVGVGGSITLSPKVQFVVESEQAAYWRAGVYDRFTGQGWVRATGPDDAGSFDPPPGQTERVVQEVTARRSLAVMPAAATPVAVSGAGYTVSAFGNPRPDGVLDNGDSYTVESAVLNPTTAELRRAGTDYPSDVRDRYLQVPASTSDAVRSLTANVTAGAETPYATARAVESWLEANKEYSLSVPTPDGNLVNQFILEQNAGYCVYYASAMAVMLRTQGVPARYVVGYTPGQRVGEDTWVVRGVDSHAWVEVYVPDVGWVRFDPTPGTPREAQETQTVADAREDGVDGVDAAGSEDGTYTTATTTTRAANTTTGNTSTQAPGIDPDRGVRTAVDSGGVNVTDPAAGGSGGDGGGVIPDVPPGTIAVWTVLVAGLLAAAHRSGVAARAYRVVWVRTTPRGSPEERVTGAFERARYLVERANRPRKRGETVAEYFEAVRADRRARELATLRDRATYGGEVTDEDADRATALAAALVADTDRRARPATLFNRTISYFKS